MIDIGTEITAPPETFHVDDLLNSGGFGRAFIATRKPSGTRVVIKVPKPNILTDPVWSQKFAREARILANIHHPNVVKIIAYWEFPDGDKALVQELIVNAKNLRQAIQASPDSAPSLFLQALYALRAFHQSSSPSIVHRDISPQNLLVTEEGILKVIDFGLAKEDPRATMVLTVTGEWFGTPGCMSPEQADNAGLVDHRTDIYALGRSFASAIQARHPQHVDCSRLADPWRTLCEKMTQHDEADRYQSVDDVILQAQALFASHNLIVSQFEHHVHEYKHRTSSQGWWRLCDQYFDSKADFQLDDLHLAALLRHEVFSPGGIDACAFLRKFENSGAVAGFEQGLHGFDPTDYLGALYRTLYPVLDAPHRILCFRRLCKVAVDYHRYYLMDTVRWLYTIEDDENIRARMVEIVDAEDPAKTIHGKGALPRTP